MVLWHLSFSKGRLIRFAEMNLELEGIARLVSQFQSCLLHLRPRSSAYEADQLGHLFSVSPLIVWSIRVPNTTRASFTD